MTTASTKTNDKPATDKPKRTRKPKALDKFQMASKATSELASLDATILSATKAAERAKDAKTERERLLASLTPEVKALMGVAS